LPGFIGPAHRNQNVADSLTFKSSFLESTTRTVRESGRPDFSSKGWRVYVEGVVGRLKKSAR
jgi:hypothetical protein